uniref:Kinesin family binding protein n=1 Tax=Leptobrachium leishanense TaxID=445787 RepID=A0A8C5Q904_9ANUR
MADSWRQVCDIYQRAVTASEVESKSDPETEPFRSKYRARELLREVRALLRPREEEEGSGQQAEAGDGQEGEDGERLLAAQLGLIEFRLGVNHTETEEMSAGEEHLVKCGRILERCRMTEECVSVYIQAQNNLGILWADRGEVIVSQRYLESAESLYFQYMKEVGKPPMDSDDLFSTEEKKLTEQERSKRFERVYTHTLYYLAQVYKHLKQDERAAQYCHTTLQRQLEYDSYNPVEWAINAATLSQYYLGKVNLVFKQPGKRLEHQGIRIEFVGQIELFNDKSNTHEFVNLVKELALPGELTQSRSYDFEFMQVEKPYESYIGSNVRLRYFLKVTIVRRISDMVKEYDLIVHQLASYPEVNNSIKMEVGIEDCLHIEFEYNKSKYHLKDVIVGKIYFLLVRIKIQHMELQLIKKEITGIGPSTTTETETVAKYEIMDGAPVKGESIPIRLFLAGYDPTPTMRDVNKKFSVRYFLNLVLVDEEDRRYFKQQEIVLWRKAPEKIRKRTNFHQRYESPDPQAPTEQPEM